MNSNTRCASSGPARHRSTGPFSGCRSVPLGVALSALLLAGLPIGAHADTVQSALVERVSATPLRYDVDGRTVTWGAGDNLVMRGFVVQERSFGYNDTVSRIALRTGSVDERTSLNPCGVFVERLDASGDRLAADYPSDAAGSGACDTVALLQSRILNRGALDLFSDVSDAGLGIERADFIFDRGSLAPFDPARLGEAGHAVAERGGDTPVQIAAILSLDVFGQPDRFGPLLRIGASDCATGTPCYAMTELTLDYALLRNGSGSPDGFAAVTGLAGDALSMAFISAEALGLRAGQRYHGFSLFPGDVDPAVHTLTDATTFPVDTAADPSTGEDAGLHGGLAGYFLAHAMPVATSRVFLDSDGNGRFNAGDANVADIDITLYRDVDANGQLDPSIDERLSDSIESDTGGITRFPGMLPGAYLLVLDADDADMPGGLAPAAGGDVRAFTVEGDHARGDVDFPLSPVGGGNGTGDGDGDGTGSGGADGGTDSGTDGGSDGGTDGGADGGTIAPPVQDDSVTAAVADAFQVNQGDVLVATVLDNDTDAAGVGLDIVSVSESANATLVIEGQTVRYTPDFGFFGSDTFTYTVQDGDGTQATGAVSVDVLRYSDIDRNLINDFEECAAVGLDCDNLELETGVHGSGIGALSLWSLAASVPLLFGMRRRRRLRPHQDQRAEVLS